MTLYPLGKLPHPRRDRDSLFARYGLFRCCPVLSRLCRPRRSPASRRAANKSRARVDAIAVSARKAPPCKEDSNHRFDRSNACYDSRTARLARRLLPATRRSSVLRWRHKKRRRSTPIKGARSQGQDAELTAFSGGGSGDFIFFAYPRRRVTTRGKTSL